MQNIALQDELRLQSAEAQGKAYMFESKEQRDENRLARLSGVQAGAQARQSSAQAGEAAAFGGIASMGGQILGAGLGGKL